MSFLNPPASTPTLGVNIAALVALRAMRPTPGALDLRYFVQVAEEAGADAIRLAIDSTSIEQRRDDVDAVMSALTEVHFAMPLTPEMIEFAGAMLPHSVCFAASDGTGETPFSETSLQLMRDAVRHLQQRSVQVVLALDPATSQLQNVADTGILTVEFNAYAVAQDTSVDQHTRWAVLHAAVREARGHGMTVHLAHGINYDNAKRFVASGDIAHIHVGHAIAVRAMHVGWAAAVREMKAAFALASASSMRQAHAGATG